MSRFWSVPLTAMVVVLLGCSATRVESEYFGPSGVIERAMMWQYERNASEGNCYNPYIDGFTRLTVLEDTPTRLVVHARYFYRDRFQDAGGDDDDGGATGICSGFGERTFTLTRSPDRGDIVISMSGQQEEPALRLLLRRLFAN